MIGFQKLLELPVGHGFLSWVANEGLSLHIPTKLTLNNGVTKREKVMEYLRANGAARGERTREMSDRTLIGQDPDVEFGEKASEIGELLGFWGGEGLDPDV